MTLGGLTEFRAAVEVLPHASADAIRAGFINRFVDTERPDYEARLNATKQFGDGSFYTGYLWEFLRSPTPVDEPTAWQEIFAAAWTYVMWDVKSADQILDPRYTNFDRSAVLRVVPEVAFTGQSFLIEDLYFFDDSWEWCVALTHEYVEGNPPERLCLVLA